MANPYVLDFSPVNNALAGWQKRNQFDQQMGFQNQQFTEGQRQFNTNNALAQSKLAILQAEAARNELMGPDKQRKLNAEIELLKAQAGFQRARSGAFSNALAPSGPPQLVEPRFAMREDGSVYEEGSDGGGGPRVESRVLGAGETVAPEATRENLDFGQYGMRARSVPGVVVTDKGNSDAFATREAQGQRAIDKTIPMSDRDRFNKFQEIQRTWSATLGKPRPGMMYDAQGREVPKGPMSASADQSERKDRAIGMVQEDINDAEKTLTSGWLPGLKRTVAPVLNDLGAPGKAANNVLGLENEAEAFNKVKMGVLQGVYALSGKQTTNKEMDAFLDNFMPKGGESADMLKSKMGRLRRMLGTLQSKVKKGMVYDDAERETLMELQGSGDRSNPSPAPDRGALRLKNKYGLE